jgi:hypothetical protein
MNKEWVSIAEACKIWDCDCKLVHKRIQKYKLETMRQYGLIFAKRSDLERALKGGAFWHEPDPDLAERHTQFKVERYERLLKEAKAELEPKIKKQEKTMKKSAFKISERYAKKLYPQPEKNCYTYAEAAAYLKLASTQIYGLLNDNMIESVLIGNKKYITLNSMNRFIFNPEHKKQSQLLTKSNVIDYDVKQEFYNTQEVAKILGKSSSTIGHKINCEITSYKPIGKNYILKQDLLDYIDYIDNPIEQQNLERRKKELIKQGVKETTETAKVEQPTVEQTADSITDKLDILIAMFREMGQDLKDLAKAWK